jgi:FkbM family methyltransferase
MEEGSLWIRPARGGICYLGTKVVEPRHDRCYFLWRRELAAEASGGSLLFGVSKGLTQSTSKGLVDARAAALTTRVSTYLKHLVNNILGLADLRLVRGALTREDTALRQILNQLAVTVVFDVGANLGQYAERLRNLGYRGRVISFEPQAAAFSVLRKKTLLDPRWEAVGLALGDQEMDQLLNVSKNSVSSSLLPIVPEILNIAPMIMSVTTERVSIKRLDQVYKPFVHPSDRIFLKLDVQGYEPKVLIGASEFLSLCTAIQVEMALFPSYQGQKLFFEMSGLIAQKGFQLIHLEPGAWDTRTGYLREVDGIFVRADDLDRTFALAHPCESVAPGKSV